MAKETAEYSISDSAGISLSMGDDGEIVTNNRGSLEMDTDELDVEVQEEDDGGDTEGNDGVDGEVDANGDDDPDGDAPADADGDLGEYDADDPEVVEAFDARYTAEDGTLDVEGALSAEYFANVAKGIDGLNEATYDYLASKGISKASVKQLEAMAATHHEAASKGVQSQDLKLFEIAGGPDALQEALAWGKSGGYSKEQQDRFNKITKGKSLEAKEEAVETLMGRYRRSDAYKKAQAEAAEAAKPKLPKRDATKAQGRPQGGVKPYESRAEMRKVRDGLRDNDTKGWAAHNRRVMASKFD